MNQVVYKLAQIPKKLRKNLTKTAKTFTEQISAYREYDTRQNCDHVSNKKTQLFSFIVRESSRERKNLTLVNHV